MRPVPKCTNPELGAALHAYELHGLSEEDTERFEIHLMECEYCFAQALGFEREATLLFTDSEVRDVVSKAGGAHPQSESVPRKLWRYLWPGVPVFLKPAIAYLLILIMAVPAYRGLMYPTVADSEIRPVEMLTLTPERSGSAPAMKISSGWDQTISFVFDGALPEKSYRVVIETEDGKEVQGFDPFHFDSNETGVLMFPHARMKPGDYHLIITDPSGEPPMNTQVYLFRIEE